MTIKHKGGLPSCGFQGFTLAELLVVLVVAGVLAATVLPALAGARTDGKSFRCMENLRRFALAWSMYAIDNNGSLVNLSTYNNTTSPPYGTPWRTQTGKVTATLPAGVSAGTTAAQKFLTQAGYKNPAPGLVGPLYGYVPNVDVLNCPGDFRVNLPAGAGYAWDSYQGTADLNGEQGGFTKQSQILTPAGRFIWVEHAGIGESLGSWAMGTLDTPADGFALATFGSSPAAFHGPYANFNYCDGHVAVRRWTDVSTVAYANDTTLTKESSGSPAKVAATNHKNPDAVWVASHYAAAQNP